MNYYNEWDQKTAAWLRELIKAELIPKGEVDERSITDVQPGDLRGFTQCHFFAGIGGWSYALQLSGWPKDKEVWTGSCPCQPYSVGATDGAKGQSDSRDCWPSFFELIKQRNPATVFGEQVKNAISWGWWDRAKMDFESIGFTAASAVMRGDAIGARHQRKRIYWMADAGSQGRERHFAERSFSCRKSETFAEHGDPLARAGSALDGDFVGLLHCDGLSVQVERDAVKGYGNAIIPQVAAEFIQAAREAIGDMTR